MIFKEIGDEERKFRKTLQIGLRKLELLMKDKEKEMKKTDLAVRTRPDVGAKSADFINAISGKKAFDLYQNYGFPFELIQEELAKHLLFAHEKEFKDEYDKEFKNIKNYPVLVLPKNSKAACRYERSINQISHSDASFARGFARDSWRPCFAEGSNITPERVRFDFLTMPKCPMKKRKN